MRNKIVLSFIIFLKLKTYFVGTQKPNRLDPAQDRISVLMWIQTGLTPQWYS